MSVKAQVQAVSEKVYQLGNKHIAGQHSLTMGELICFGIAALMVFAPSLWAKMPVVGKYASPAIAIAILLIAFVIW